jgi:hypothetical protein
MRRIFGASLLLVACSGCVTVLESPDSHAPPKPVCAGDPWAKAFPGIAAKPGGVAPDGACGVVFTAGGQTDFGTGETGEVNSVALVRLDSIGHTLWARHFGHDIALEPPRVAVDPDADIVIAGIAGTPFDLGKGEIASIGQEDIYVAKLDPKGEVIWTRRFGGPQYNHDRHSLEAFAVGPSGELLLAGFFENEIDFGLGPLTAPEQALAGFVVKLSASGKPLWQRGYDAVGVPFANAGLGGAAFGASGEVVIAGFSGGEIDPGTGPFSVTPHTASTFVTAYSSEGEPLWTRHFAGTGEATPHALAVDSAGAVIVEGRLTGSMTVDGFTVEGSWGETGYLLKLDGAGKAVFASHLDDAPAGLAVDADRDILVVSDGVTKLHPDGTPVWTRGGASAYWSVRRDAVAVDATGNVLVTSVAGGDIDFDVAGVQAGSGQPPTFAANLGK